jgi:hypothetical protein
MEKVKVKREEKKESKESELDQIIKRTVVKELNQLLKDFQELRLETGDGLWKTGSYHPNLSEKLQVNLLAVIYHKKGLTSLQKN